MGEKSFIYRCSLQKWAPLHGYLSEKGALLTSLVKTEKFLESLAPFKSRLNISILPENGWIYHLEDETLTLNRNLMESAGTPEKAVIKTWLRDQNSNFFYNDLLAEEVFSDLILTMIQGNFRLNDPTGEQQIPIKHQVWPTVLKTVSGYCHSAWKIAEHYQMCNNLEDSGNFAGNELMEMSLRPLLSSAWIGMYDRLSLSEKVEFFRNIVDVIRQLKIDKQFHFNVLQASPEDPLGGLALNVQRLNSVWTNAYQQITLPTYRHLMAYLASELASKGFRDMIEVAEFDLVYLSDEVLDKKSPRIQALNDLALKNPTLRILLRDPTQAWFMPSRDPVSAQIIRKTRSQKMILETCKRVDFSRILNFGGETSKLLVVRACDPAKKLSFQGFVKNGAEGFALQNQKVSFVQFHLPSVIMKKKELIDAGDVFRFVGQRKIDSPSFQSLGWQKLDFNYISQSYKPKAYTDAIELFRVFPHETSTSISNL